MAFIGKLVKGIGKAVSSVVNVVKKVWNNPLFKLALNVGMMFIPGGAVLKGLSMLGKLGQIGQSVASFAGFAQKFLGPVQNLLSSGPLKMLSGFLGNAGGTGDLLSMATSLFKSQASQPQPPPVDDTAQMAQFNVQQMFAFTQANFLRNSLLQES